MRKRTIDKNMPIGKLIQIKDELPSPAQLVRHERTVKVTLRLSEASIKFFKSCARTHNTKYQKLIRSLVDAYTTKFAVNA